MTKYFLTKTWGFNPETHPLLGFGNDGALRTYLKDSDLDSWLLIAGTKGESTSESQRGRLLGMVKLGRNQVDSEAVLGAIDVEIEHKDRDLEGRYRWPFGLPMLEAYTFDGWPYISDVFGHGLAGTVWASTARNIELAKDVPDNIVEIIDQLPITECSIHSIPEFEEEVIRQQLERVRREYRGATGPGPTSERGGSTIKKGWPVTYILSLEGLKRRNVVKVGYTNNIERRIKELNSGLLTPISGLKWVVSIAQPHNSGLAAYACEQMVHEKLVQYLVPGEREIYDMKINDCASALNDVHYKGGFMRPELQTKYSEGYSLVLKGEQAKVVSEMYLKGDLEVEL